ncbi:leucine-rich repeat-containing protein 43-like [Oscarella lobularis]|uniref:leucine-rich repeat-containing protein 43-like n=1 Tax=Oscarella lobularis TaxID=121494 RepID=UPI0033143B5F
MAQGRRTASQVVSERLASLNLTSFPCGKGNWRNEKFFDYDASVSKGNESVEDLLDYAYAQKSPWTIDCSWSSEARTLRDVAIRSPGKLDDPDYARKSFQTLKLINENINEVDEKLAVYENVSELSLSCNHLSVVNGRNLPKQLKVLELCDNQLSNPLALCPGSPPSVRHVGLGYNRLQNLNWLQPASWPLLLSLDLSFNHLTSLPEVVLALSSLAKLRNLVLQGNPVSLVPAYRPYVIEKLSSLTVLDDVRIIPDDRRVCENLCDNIQEDDLKEVGVSISVEQLQGICAPPEEDVLTDPMKEKVEHLYHVEYDYVPLQGQPVKGEMKDVFCTQELTWADPMSFNYSMEHSNTQLDQCCGFFMRGIAVRVIQARTVSVAPSETNIPTNARSPKADNKTSKKKTGKKTPPASTVPKDKGAMEKDKRNKGGKKNQESDVDWIKRPPELKCVAQGAISLRSLLLGHGSPLVQDSSFNLTLEEGNTHAGNNDEGEDKPVTLSVAIQLRRHPIALKLQ